MPIRKVELERMTYKEVEAAFAEKPVIIVPMGSTEQHGPQAPMGDFRIAKRLAIAIAEQTPAYVAPVIPYSEGAASRDFPGAVPLRPETFYSLIWDVCEAYLRFGLDHIVLLCGDHGNMPIIERLIRDIKDTHGIRIAALEQFRWYTPELREKIYGERNPAIGHGADPVTSLNMYWFPEDMRMDLAVPREVLEFQGLKAKTLSQVAVGEQVLYLPIDYKEVSPSGCRGDVALSSEENGRQYTEFLVATGVKLIDAFKKITTQI